jgi:hypothetical protein
VYKKVTLPADSLHARKLASTKKTKNQNAFIAIANKTRITVFHPECQSCNKKDLS